MGQATHVNTETDRS